MSKAREIFDAAFSKPRDPRSDEYRHGVLDVMKYRLGEANEALHLPNDIARCPGVRDAINKWRDGCERCVRRTDRTNMEMAAWMPPPPMVGLWCEFLIEPQKEKLNDD